MKRVLILEDDEPLGRGWQRALEQAGLRVVHETTAEGAIEAYDEQPFDLVITDFFIRSREGRLSQRGGLSLLSHIRLESHPMPAIITLTGSAIPAITAQHAELLGAATSLRKPVKIEFLVALAQDLLDDS